MVFAKCSGNSFKIIPKSVPFPTPDGPHTTSGRGISLASALIAFLTMRSVVDVPPRGVVGFEHVGLRSPNELARDSEGALLSWRVIATDNGGFGSIVTECFAAGAGTAAVVAALEDDDDDDVAGAAAAAAFAGDAAAAVAAAACFL